MPEQGKKFVVTHSAVDSWRQGDLISDDDEALGYEVRQRGPDGSERVHKVDKRQRLIALGAIRPATEEEVRAGRGFAAPVPGLQAESQMRLAAVDAELDQLRRLLGDQQEKLDSYIRLGVQGAIPPRAAGQPEEDPALAPLLEERRAEVAQLKARAEENDKKLTELHEKVMKEADEKQQEAERRQGDRGPPPPGGAPSPDQAQQSSVTPREAARGKPVETPTKITTVQDARREAEEKQRHKKE